VASLPPPIPENPYQRILYEALREHGIRLVRCDRLHFAWLWRHRREARVLHFHWPTPYYRHQRGSPRLRRMLSWVRFCLLALRLWAGRAIGYRIVWTVHEVYPHELVDPSLDRAAAKLLARASHVLIVHDEPTRAALEDELPGARGKVERVPHLTFAGAYPEGRGRAAARAELGIEPDAFVLLCFGHLREYKDVDVLVEAFRTLPHRHAVLVVAGPPVSDRVVSELEAAVAADPRIRLVPEFVEAQRVVELHAASDVAVVSRGDGGTSGALVLALSLGLPVVAAARPAYEELTREGAVGWHFRPRDASSLAAVLAAAIDDPAETAEKRARVARGSELAAGWQEVAARTAPLLHGRLG
jgi:glycosyltransferase involved in cell wall biosynthesis